MSNNTSTSSLIRKILSDVRVALGSEFDRNFEREAFFTEAWQRRSSPLRPGGHILIDRGSLRRSIRTKISHGAVDFESDLPYAAIHNEGGEIVVTERMRRFFWHKFYATSERLTRRKDGTLSRSKKNIQISTEAEFWRRMALMKVGHRIKIPRRRFLGTSPEVEQIVKKVIDEGFEEFFNNYNLFEKT